MPIVIENDELSAALRQVSGSVEFVSKDGRSLGVFTPAGAIPPDLEPRISDWVGLSPVAREQVEAAVLGLNNQFG